MNKQRKVLITITYNEMGIIIDTKAEEVAQPVAKDINVPCTDTISRQAAIDAIGERPLVWTGCDYELGCVNQYDLDKLAIETVPSVQPNTIGTTTDTTIGTTTDCISRQDAIDALIRARKPINNGDGTSTIMPLTDAVIRKVLTALPSVQERKGRWLRYGEDGYPNEKDTVAWQCDQCLTTYYGRTERIANYCPNCGAHMGGEQDDND